MLATDRARPARTTRPVRRALVAAAATLVALTLVATGAFDLGPARAGDRAAAAAPTPLTGDQTVTKLVRYERPWTVGCSGDVCMGALGLLPMDLPAAWSGQKLRLTATVTFNHRIKGGKHLWVSARVGSGPSNFKRLAPKRWRILRSGPGYDTSTVRFTKRVTVPENAQVHLVVGPEYAREFRIRGTKALWSVTASR